MKFHILNRKVHYWASLLVAFPVLVMIGTGLLLHLKKDWNWVQPTEQKGSGKTPKIDFEQILQICQGVEAAEIKDWSDIRRVDVRPSRGIMKVWAKNGYEIQIDINPPHKVLQVEYRRSDTIEALHDGSWFAESVKWYVFLPAGIILFVMWLTGIYLFVLPQWIKWRRRKKAA